MMGTREELFNAACRSGLEANINGKSFTHFAEKMAQIGLDGLSRYQPHNVDLLTPLINRFKPVNLPLSVY